MPDLRNSRVPDIVSELKQFGIAPLVHDPLANTSEAQEEYGITLQTWEQLTELDALIIAVNHKTYLEMSHNKLLASLRPDGILIDVKSVLDPRTLPNELTYWSL